MITVTGTFAGQRDRIERRIAARLLGAVSNTTAAAQADLRGQARAAGFRDGGRAVANTWRKEVYPKPGVGPRSWRPGALVWSKVPLIVEAFDRGAVITAKRGKFLAIPTPQNLRRKAGRGGKRSNLLFTPEQMAKSERAFFRPLNGSRNALLWCLRLESRTTRRGNTQIFAGERKLFRGNSVAARARRRGFATVGYVAMFVLLRRVTLRKRLDLKGAATRARSRLRAEVAQGLRA